MIKAIIFDFDGTILDTETPDFHSWCELFEDHGHQLEQEVWCRVVGTTWDAFNPFDYLEEKIGRTVNREHLREVVRRSCHKKIEQQVPLPGVESALETAKEIGLKLAVASSSPRAWVEGHLDRLELLEYFDVLKTADDVPKVKPDPALYREACAGLGVAPADVIAFEDSVNGVKAAKAAGIYCVAIPNFVTSKLDFGEADHKVESLEHFDLRKALSDL